ncbi:MAG: hypothetical protein A3H57_03970 [Candidatus Taylorbacteria bacterium RIFCSPLOWO2_02_FULL_43_11]|uniref:Glycosyltransferase RgtA/B/C/D-like domain-containing protein n=1 Tax=Candidatus Taylorbacteria bacterium RIFCSPHIGHO2_02_FULL_43_32b TaxID=1802306 RepID=A0A1G2MJ77_9BACT|nr:MAG: hypothetical protein A2743_01695 [Candidatus Taylorbacteria bacterium RIFCSPHIGHO2_01_FULL_43_47]OHA23933.1 MAG: hypothetical protein A3C72_00525 [Candidatus Taylorbacteria bacterium RIFCSPHIGHO2_02_FULL_43_32b]OHA30997.1 MAG: hypothetical protein A3B08_04370 [Candidatus Taylorbacteria bacterium RIFCSPLOWO2_01_FULL_43_44]OHA37205.1 MAG: hypothetical protein A3H57_03970 [Candidatus Taylorbacteria bacterium RIFCSPLOWO2_02_FULL_43_11]
MKHSLLKFRDVVKVHWGIVLGAFFMSFLVSSPLIFFPMYAGDRYQGINIAHFGTDEHYYLTRAKEVLEGHSLGQPVLAEGKEKQDPTFSKAELVLTAPIRLFQLQDKVSIVTVYNIYNFLAVFLIVIFIYALQFSLSRNRLIALATALFVVGGYSIVYNKALFYEDFNIYGRSAIPWAALIPFYLMLICLYQGITKSKMVWMVASGLIFGFLFHDYFYAWTLSLSLLSAMIVSYLLFRQPKIAKSVMAPLFIGVVIGVPVIWGMLELYRSPIGDQLSYFLMSSPGRVAVFSKIGFISLLLLGILFWKNRSDKNIPFLLGTVATTWIVLNEQVITGKYIQYGHYYWYFIVPLSIITSAYIVFNLFPSDLRVVKMFSFVSAKFSSGISIVLNKVPLKDSLYKIRSLALFTLIVIIFLNTSVGQYRSFFTVNTYKLREQDYAPLIDRLRQMPQGVILVSDHGYPYPMLFNIYTNHDLFWEGHALIHQFPIDHLKDAFFLNMYLNRDARDDFSGYLTKLLEDKKHNSYTFFFESLEGFYSGLDIYEYRRQAEKLTPLIADLRYKLIESLAKEYSARIGGGRNVSDLIDEYSVKYVVWDKKMNPEWDLSVLPLTEELNYRDLVLFSLKPMK